MIIKRGYKAELDLNNEQVTACRKHAGAARWAYNYLRHEVACVAVETGLQDSTWCSPTSTLPKPALGVIQGLGSFRDTVASLKESRNCEGT